SNLRAHLARPDPALRLVSVLRRWPAARGLGAGLGRAFGAPTVLFGRSGALLPRALRATLGPRLHGDVQPGSPRRTRAAAPGSRVELAGGALRAGGLVLPRRHRVACQRGASRAPATRTASGVLQPAAVHAQPDAAGYGARRVRAERPHVRG